MINRISLKKLVPEFIFPAVCLIIIIIAVVIVQFNTEPNKEAYKLNWERIIDSNDRVSDIYRTRIYGGWLVKSGTDIIFIELNHPDNWVLEK